MLRAAEGSGFRVVSFAEADRSHRAEDFWAVWETAFAHHWGTSPTSLARSWEQTFARTEPVGAHEASVIAYRDGQPVGVTLCLPDLSSQAGLVGDRELLPEERLNLFGIGVVENV